MRRGPGLLFPERIGPVRKLDPVGETLPAVASVPWLGSQESGLISPALLEAGPAGRPAFPARSPRSQTSGCRQVLPKVSSHLFLGSNQGPLFWETVIC